MIDEAVMNGVKREFETVGNAELVKDVVNMHLDGRLGDEECGRNLAVCEAVLHVLEYFPLASREQVTPVIERQRRELDRIRAGAVDQSVVAMARGALMERLGLSSAEAARQLAELSAATGVPPGQMAATVLSPDEPHLAVDCVAPLLDKGPDIATIAAEIKDAGERTNPNAMAALRANCICANVALTPEGDVWWEGMTETPPPRLIDWQGQEWTPDSGRRAGRCPRRSAGC